VITPEKEKISVKIQLKAVMQNRQNEGVNDSV